MKASLTCHSSGFRCLWVLQTHHSFLWSFIWNLNPNLKETLSLYTPIYLYLSLPLSPFSPQDSPGSILKLAFWTGLAENLRDPLPSASWVLGFKVWAPTTRHSFSFFTLYFPRETCLAISFGHDVFSGCLLLTDSSLAQPKWLWITVYGRDLKFEWNNLCWVFCQHCLSLCPVVRWFPLVFCTNFPIIVKFLVVPPSFSERHGFIYVIS